MLQRLGKGKRAVKVALMDQSVVAGLGNIHAAEALWRARIHPARPCAWMNEERARAVLRGIKASFKLVLDADDGKNVAYVEDAGGINPFKIYARPDAPCPRCRTTLRSMTLGGRTTWFCPACQRTR